MKLKALMLAILLFAVHPLSSIAQNSWINVKSSGAAGNGVTDDTASINAAISLLPARGGVLYFPSGKYRMSQKLVLPDKRVTLIGDGTGISTIEWINSDGGIHYAPTLDSSPSGDDVGRELDISKLTLRTSVAGGGTAIRAQWPETEGRVTKTLTLQDVEIRGSDFTRHWNGGINLTGAKNSTIRGVHVFGNSINHAAMGYGLRIHSNASSTEYFVSDLEVTFADLGVWIEGGSSGLGVGPEGIYIDQSALISVNTGVLANTQDSEPLLFVRGSHIAAKSVGIHSRALQSVIANNLIYHSSPAAVGVILFGLASDVSVSGNMFYGTRSPDNTTSVVVTNGVRRASIVNNHFDSATTAVWLQSGSADSFVAQGVFANVGNRVINSGSNNTVLGWGSSPP